MQMRLFLSGFLATLLSGTMLAFVFKTEEPACLIQLDRQNIFYVGVDNPVSILVRGVPEEAVRIEAAGVRLQQTADGKYIVQANTVGEGVITVSGGNLKPVKYTYRVKRIPDPVMRLGGRHTSGYLSNGEFKAQPGLFADMGYFDFDTRCTLLSYRVARVRGEALLAEAVNTDARFESAAKAVVAQATPGDTYYFDEIKVKCPGDAAARVVEGLMFRIR